MNTRTRWFKPRVRVLISARLLASSAHFNGPDKHDPDTCGWPAGVYGVPDTAMPNAAAPWVSALESAAITADAAVCLLVAADPQNLTTAAPWQTQIYRHIKEWRRDWHPNPFSVRCLTLSSAAQAGGFCHQLLGLYATESTGPLTFDACLQRALTACQQLQECRPGPLNIWRWRPLPDALPTRWHYELGANAVAHHLFKEVEDGQTLVLCGPAGILATFQAAPSQPPGELKASIADWLQTQKRGGEHRPRFTSCVTTDLHPKR
ncbi:MAG: hypothetical protein WEB07_00965 [Natronospirillum sp.]